MITVALFGAEGFVGKKIHHYLLASKKYLVTPVNRPTYPEKIGKFYNIVINSAMPSARFWAKNNPKDDFRETIEKTANIFYGTTFDKFVQVSSVSARCQLDTIYGRHKLAAEDICNNGHSLIARLGPMFDEELKKGVLIDMLKGQKVFVSEKSRYAFASLDFVASYLVSHLDLKGIVEIGAFNTVKLSDIKKYLKADIEFEGAVDIQEIENPAPGFPNASEVFKFLDKLKKKL